MPSQRCVVQDFDNCADLVNGISIHKSPTEKKLLAKWTNFVRTRRCNILPSAQMIVLKDESTLQDHGDFLTMMLFRPSGRKKIEFLVRAIAIR